jgi:hypothetical protein
MIGEFRVLGPRGDRSSVLLWIAGEIFIVVAGVLIAFALNAWWAERSARIEEQTHLRALIRDFEENVGVFGELITRARRTSDASLELLQLARKQPDTDPAVVGSMIGPVFSSYRKKPALDAYEALASSGGLTLIRDEKLRAALAGFADRSSEPYQERFSDEVYLAFTNRYIGQMQIAAGVAGDAAQPKSFADLLSDAAFQEHLAYRYVLERNVVSHYEDRLSEARDVLEQLRSQLDDSGDAGFLD